MVGLDRKFHKVATLFMAYFPEEKRLDLTIRLCYSLIKFSLEPQYSRYSSFSTPVKQYNDVAVCNSG